MIINFFKRLSLVKTQILLIFAVAVLPGCDNPDVKKFLSDIILGAKIENQGVGSLSCETDVKGIVEEAELKNKFGATFKIIKIKNFQEISKSDKSIICRADAMFDNAKESKVRIEVYEDDDGDLMYKIEEQL